MNRGIANKTIGASVAAVVAIGALTANAQSTADTAPGTTTNTAITTAATTGAPPRHRPDAQIVRDVRRAVRRVPDLDDSQIHIRASHGVVTLSGTVPETWQVSRARNAARSVRGVTAVRNRLTVQ